MTMKPLTSHSLVTACAAGAPTSPAIVPSHLKTQLFVPLAPASDVTNLRIDCEMKKKMFLDVVCARAELGMPAGSSQLFRDRSAIRPLQERVRKQLATTGARSLQGVAPKAPWWGANKVTRDI